MSNTAERLKVLQGCTTLLLASGTQYVRCTIALNAATDKVDVGVQNTKTI